MELALLPFLVLPWWGYEMECCLRGGEETTGEVLSAGAGWIPLPAQEGRQGRANVQLIQQLRQPPSLRPSCWPPAGGQSQPTVLQVLVDHNDQLPFGLAAGGPGAGRAAAEEELVACHRETRLSGRSLTGQAALLVQQGRLLLPWPNGGTWNHVHSHAAG